MWSTSIQVKDVIIETEVGIHNAKSLISQKIMGSKKWRKKKT